METKQVSYDVEKNANYGCNCRFIPESTNNLFLVILFCIQCVQFKRFNKSKTTENTTKRRDTSTSIWRGTHKFLISPFQTQKTQDLDGLGF